VWRPQIVGEPRDRSSAGGVVAHIGGGPSMHRTEGPRRDARSLLIHIDHADPRPLLDEQSRGPAADAARGGGAGHDGDLAVQQAPERWAAHAATLDGAAPVPATMTRCS